MTNLVLAGVHAKDCGIMAGWRLHKATQHKLQQASQMTYALGIEGTAAKTLSRKTHEYSVVWA